jgi:hypothetical protein
MKNPIIALVEIGRFVIVTAIAIIANVLFDVSTLSTSTQVSINGSDEGFAIALLSIFFLIIVWYKFEVFTSFSSKPKMILLLITTTAAYIICISISAILAIDSRFCNPSLYSSRWLDGGLAVLLLSDFILLYSDYKNNSGYIEGLKNSFKIAFAVTLFFLRVAVVIGYFFFLSNPRLYIVINNKYSHGLVLCCSIILAIYSEFKFFPKNRALAIQ